MAKGKTITIVSTPSKLIDVVLAPYGSNLVNGNFWLKLIWVVWVKMVALSIWSTGFAYFEEIVSGFRIFVLYCESCELAKHC